MWGVSWLAEDLLASQEGHVGYCNTTKNQNDIIKSQYSFFKIYYFTIDFVISELQKRELQNTDI
jgi:hypothetical protein